MTKQKLTLGFASYKFEVSNETNCMPFSGVCAYVDRPSEGVPSGAGGKPVAFDKDAMLQALPHMVGQAINCYWSAEDTKDVLSGHDRKFKIGVVDKAELHDDEVYIEGHFWDYDFKDECNFIKTAKDAIGFSVDVLIGELEDKGTYLIAKDIDLIGAAVLFKDLAAFKTTYLAASDASNRERAEFAAYINKKYKNTKLSGREQFRKAMEKKMGVVR